MQFTIIFSEHFKALVRKINIFLIQSFNMSTIDVFIAFLLHLLIQQVTKSLF